MSELQRAFQFQIRVFQVYGIWPTKRYNLLQPIFFAITFILSVTFTMTISSFIIEEKTLERKTISIAVSFTCILTVVRMLNCCLNHQKIRTLLEHIDELSLNQWTAEEYGNYLDTLREVKMFIKLAKTFHCCVAIGMLVQPLISWKLALPLAVWFPMKPKDNVTEWLLEYGLQAIQTISVLLITIAVDTFPVSILLLIEGHVGNLGHRLISLSTEQPNTWKRKFKQCVQGYAKIIRYCEEFKDIFSWSFLVQTALNCGGLSSIMYASVSVPGKVEELYLLLTLLTITYQIFILCYMGNKVSAKSEELSFQLYSSDWIHPNNNESRKDMLLFMIMLKQPIKITFGGIYVLSLETFAKIVNATYSLYTLTKSFKE